MVHPPTLYTYPTSLCLYTPFYAFIDSPLSHPDWTPVGEPTPGRQVWATAMGLLGPETIFGIDTDVLFAYHTTKRVKILDRRLGFTRAVFLFTILSCKNT